MADKVICNKSDLVNIANSVRTKLGVADPYYVSDLSGAIDSISTQSTPTLQEKTVTPSTSMQSITADNGYDGLSKVTVNGDADLIANNIKSGTNIFGVTGTYVDSTPIEISTDAGMEAVLTSNNVGKVYKFTGTSDTYTNGDLYIVEVG